jgi:hypothetical protein
MASDSIREREVDMGIYRFDGSEFVQVPGSLDTIATGAGGVMQVTRDPQLSRATADG